MSEFGANEIHPLEIQDARNAAIAAAQNQKDCEQRLRVASRELANAERKFRQLLSERILDLHRKDGLAITTCEGIAKGEDEVSELRHERDIAKGLLEAVQQESFRRGADRRDVNLLLQWSQQRDLRTDVEPHWSGQPVTGGAGANLKAAA